MKIKIESACKYILFDIFLYVVVFLSINIILYIFGYVFLNWFMNLNVILIFIGIIIGAIQFINKAIKKKKTKIILGIIFVLIEINIIFPITFLYFLLQDYEEIVYIENKKMVKETHSVLFSNWITYYDYENIFVRKQQKRIFEAHDDCIGEYLYTNYYDESGNLIKTNDAYYRNSEIYSELENNYNAD